jgi:hypothetical protein
MTAVSRAHFDWYQATVRADEEAVLTSLEGATWANAPAINRYSCGVQDERSGVRVYWGGNPGTNVLGSGGSAESAAIWLRERWPEHLPSRIDSAIDMRANFESVWTVLRGAGLREGLELGQSGDWVRCLKGRTFYLGSRKSDSFVRCYEKGLQLGGDPGWVRAEAVSRGKTRQRREWLATAEPAAIWSVGRAARAALEGMRLGEPIEVPSSGRKGREALDVSIVFMIRQYGMKLDALAERYGDLYDDATWEAVGRVIGRARKMIRQDGSISETAWDWASR